MQPVSDDIAIGYLTAVATMLRINHDWQTAAALLREGSIGPREIHAAKMTNADTRLLMKAWGYDSADAAQKGT